MVRKNRKNAPGITQPGIKVNSQSERTRKSAPERMGQNSTKRVAREEGESVMAFICAICLTLLVVVIDAFIGIACFVALAKFIDYWQSR
nr:MAG TPA: hypothetical protein [Caudoviricetes sp.]